MTRYEAIFILDDRKFDDNGESFIHGKVAEQLKALGGELHGSDPMGKRQMAHPIRKRNTAYFWDILYTLDPSQAKEFTEAFRLDSSVLRLTTYVYVEPPPPPRERETADADN